MSSESEAKSTGDPFYGKTEAEIVEIRLEQARRSDIEIRRRAPYPVKFLMDAGWFNVQDIGFGQWTGEPPGGNAGYRLTMYEQVTGRERWQLATELLKVMAQHMPARLGEEPDPAVLAGEFARAAVAMANAIANEFEHPELAWRKGVWPDATRD